MCAHLAIKCNIMHAESDFLFSCTLKAESDFSFSRMVTCYFQELCFIGGGKNGKQLGFRDRNLSIPLRVRGSRFICKHCIKSWRTGFMFTRVKIFAHKCISEWSSLSRDVKSLPRYQWNKLLLPSVRSLFMFSVLERSRRLLYYHRMLGYTLIITFNLRFLITMHHVSLSSFWNTCKAVSDFKKKETGNGVVSFHWWYSFSLFYCCLSTHMLLFFVGIIMDNGNCK